MLAGMVSVEPGGSHVVKVPSGVRRKPCTAKPASSYCPVIVRAELMLVGKVKIQPKGSKVAKVPSLARRKPCSIPLVSL
jgi:hypothetical protein